MKAYAGIPVAEAAERLRVNSSRLRAMIRSGILDAQKLGDRWVVDPASLDRREAARPARGRPYSARNAWALLLMGSGKSSAGQGKLVKQLSPWALSRVRSRLKTLDLASVASRFRSRAKVVRLRAHRSDLERIESEPYVVRAGVSAARGYGIDIVAPGEIEIYTPVTKLAALKRKYSLLPDSKPNVILHVVDEPWPFSSTCRVVPPAVAALDLLETDDDVSQRAGRDLLARLGAPWSN